MASTVALVGCASRLPENLNQLSLGSPDRMPAETGGPSVRYWHVSDGEPGFSWNARSVVTAIGNKDSVEIALEKSDRKCALNRAMSGHTPRGFKSGSFAFSCSNKQDTMTVVLNCIEGQRVMPTHVSIKTADGINNFDLTCE
jgi:hypothetical protein